MRDEEAQIQIGRIESGLTWAQFVVVRLVRRWAAAHDSASNPLPSMVQLADEIGEPAEAAVALHSLFQLTEDRLGRPLEAECCAVGK